MRDFLIIRGDSSNSGLFNKEFIDLTVTSPPYNVGIQYNSYSDDLDYGGYIEFSRRWMSNLYAWTKDRGRFCLNISLDQNLGGRRSTAADLTMVAKECGWRFQSNIVWVKNHVSRRTAWGSWLSAASPCVIAPIELVIVFCKGEWKKGEGESSMTRQEFMDWTSGLWTFTPENAKGIGHPAPFPVELPLRCIKLFSFVGEHIFDPFLGSGTTGIAAGVTGRNFTGVEIDKGYLNLAKRRIQDATFLQGINWEVRYAV